MAQPTRYVLTSQDTDINHVVNNPMNLASLLKQAFQNVPSRASSSGMSILAAGIGSSGKVFLGVSVELLGLPPHHSIHAEQFLVANLALNSERQLTHLAITGDGYNFDAPCGYCRQFLHEIPEASSIKILIKNTAKNEEGKFETLENLLPCSSYFNPLLLEPQDNKLALLHPDCVGKTCAGHERCKHLNCMDLAATNRSFTPNSESPSGVALMDKLGNVYRGWFMESVAYGLSLGPVQAALVDFVARGGTEFNTIVQAVLVEKQHALVSQEEATRMILKKITNGNCVTNVFHCDLDVEELLNVFEVTEGEF